jgi:hypothetical protein
MCRSVKAKAVYKPRGITAYPSGAGLIWVSAELAIQRRFGRRRRQQLPKPFEDSTIEVGQTKKATRKLASTRIARGLEDFDNIARFRQLRVMYRCLPLPPLDKRSAPRRSWWQALMACVAATLSFSWR